MEKRSGLEAADLDKVLATHLLDPSTLRAADFDAFFASRRAALIGLIAEAMGKPVVEDLTPARSSPTPPPTRLRPTRSRTTSCSSQSEAIIPWPPGPESRARAGYLSGATVCNWTPRGGSPAGITLMNQSGGDGGDDRAPSRQLTITYRLLTKSATRRSALVISAEN